MGKAEVFELELGLIQDEKIRKFTEEMLDALPDYFYVVPASSTGKYHPKYALGDQGLVRHVQAAVRIAYEMYRCNTVCGKFTEIQKDIMLSALLLHDGCKSGIEKQTYTVVEHPLEVVKFCKQNNAVKELISKEIFDSIMDCIKTHMGEWTFDFKTKRNVLEKPQNALQKFVHMCDYLASRKPIEFNFDAPLSK
jgi:hypothetical protein